MLSHGLNWRKRAGGLSGKKKSLICFQKCNKTMRAVVPPGVFLHLHERTEVLLSIGAKHLKVWLAYTKEAAKDTGNAAWVK